jgi:hypothetical protein
MAKLSNNERSPYTDTITLNAADLIAIGNNGTKIIGCIPAGGAVELVAVVNTIDIVGSSTLSIGIGTTLATPVEFISALDVDAMTVGLPTFNTGTSMVQVAGTTTVLAGVRPAAAVSAVTPIYIKVTDAAIASITAGQIVIGMRVLDLTQFAE